MSELGEQLMAFVRGDPLSLSEDVLKLCLSEGLGDLYTAMRDDVDRCESRRPGAAAEDFEWRQLVVESRAPWRHDHQLDWASGGDRARPRWRKDDERE